MPLYKYVYDYDYDYDYVTNVFRGPSLYDRVKWKDWVKSGHCLYLFFCTIATIIDEIKIAYVFHAKMQICCINHTR